MTFAVDIDGVLTLDIVHYTKFDKAKPDELVIDCVNEMYCDGHRIILHTSRREEDREITERWLKKHGVNYHKIVFDKPLADYYIDNKAVNIKDFDKLLRKLL